MGYPMTYQRVISRNWLRGDYTDKAPYRDESGNVAARDTLADFRCMVAGDLRRLERNSRDPRHLDAYARKTGLTSEQVKAVLDAFFDSDFPCLDYERFPPRWTEHGVALYDEDDE